MAVNATAVWRVRPSGSNTNGAGYDSAISGAGTDFSQQNAAQASGVHGTATGTTTFIDATANAFTAAMVGNCIQIASGAGFTAGFYFVTAFTSASTVTLDRSPGTGTVAVWALGGGWADPLTNCTTSGPLVGGNFVYILGSGTPNPASYTYDYVVVNGAFPSIAVGSGTTGAITFANDPATPGYKAYPDTTGGMPCIQWGDIPFHQTQYNNIYGLYFVGGASSVGRNVVDGQGAGAVHLIGCVLDQFGYDSSFAISNQVTLSGCEAFSSVVPGSSGTNGVITTASAYIVGCNFHDTVGPGINVTNSGEYLRIQSSIIAKCRGVGIFVPAPSSAMVSSIENCTIDGNLGSGIEFASGAAANQTVVRNNIISNHTQSGTFGVTVDTGVASGIFDYNTFYNNTTDLNAISYGPHDTHGGANPYVGQGTENYTLA